MAQKNKALPYLIFGVPIAIGLFFVYKYVRNSMGKGLPKLSDATTTNTTTTTTTSGSSTTTPTEQSKLPFKKGMQSQYYIGNIQKKLGISADGKFGSQTQSSVKSFQKSNGLTTDGIVGAKTWKALFGADFPLMSSNVSVEPKRVGVTPLVMTNTPDKPYVLGGSDFM